MSRYRDYYHYYFCPACQHSGRERRETRCFIIISCPTCGKVERHKRAPLPTNRYGDAAPYFVSDVIDYWIEWLRSDAYQSGKPQPNAFGCVRRGSLYYERDRLYHYGHHYCLAWATRNVRTGHVRHVHINVAPSGYGHGGRGPSTRERSWEVRRALQRAGFRIYESPTVTERKRAAAKLAALDRWGRRKRRAATKRRLRARRDLRRAGRRLRTHRMALGVGKTQMVMRALLTMYGRDAVYLLDWNVKRATVGPIRDRRYELIERAVDYYAKTYIR